MRKKGQEESPTFLRKKKGEELTKGGTVPSSLGPLSSIAARHPLPSGGTAIAGPCGTSSSGGTATGGPTAGLEHPLPPAGP
jgi:hypothetical protein